jgi:ribosomal protein L7/L12
VSNEDIAALGERISRLERVVTALAERANLSIQDLSVPSAPATGFASDGAGTGFASVEAEADPEILQLVAAGDMIRAIKRYRELTGTDLRGAKEAVERLASS